MAKNKGKPEPTGLNASATHLLHRALRLGLDFYADASGNGAVTQRQLTVLAAAGAAPGLTQNDLVRATGIDRSTLAELVSRMLKLGLLERRRSATDARANTVTLSAAGRSALTAGAGPSAAADERLLGLLSPKKREVFLKTLATLAAAADQPASTKAASPAKPKKKKRKKARKTRDIGA